MPTGTVPSVGTVHGDTGSLEEFRKENEELTGRRTPTGCRVRVTYRLLGSATKVRSGIGDCAQSPVRQDWNSGPDRPLPEGLLCPVQASLPPAGTARSEGVRLGLAGREPQVGKGAG